MKKNIAIDKAQEHLIKDARLLVQAYPKVPLTVDCVIFGFEENKLKVLVIKSDLEYYKEHYSLLGDIVKDNEIYFNHISFSFGRCKCANGYKGAR